MTPDQKLLAMWGGGALAIILIGGFILGGRADSLAENKGKALDLHRRYAALYPAEGMTAADAELKLGRLVEHQKRATEQAENFLVPNLPKEYEISDQNRASSLANQDLVELTQRAQRQKVELPASLPFKSGLDQEEDERSLQLAQLYLYRTVLNVLMDVGVTKIESVSTGKSTRDSSGNYAVVTCQFSFTAEYQSCQQLLMQMLNCHEIGIGLRAIDIEQSKDASQKVRMTASLLLVNRASWNLPVEAAPVAARGVSTEGAAPTRPGRITRP
jgi:hypothetical protein